jgi:hypothetical protein
MKYYKRLTQRAVEYIPTTPLQISHNHYVNILLPIQCKRGCGIYSTVFAYDRLRDEGAHEVKREGAVPGTVGSHTKSHAS